MILVGENEAAGFDDIGYSLYPHNNVRCLACNRRYTKKTDDLCSCKQPEVHVPPWRHAGSSSVGCLGRYTNERTSLRGVHDSFTNSLALGTSGTWLRMTLRVQVTILSRYDLSYLNLRRLKSRFQHRLTWRDSGLHHHHHHHQIRPLSLKNIMAGACWVSVL